MRRVKSEKWKVKSVEILGEREKERKKEREKEREKERGGER